jgi:hypothetical protein
LPQAIRKDRFPNGGEGWRSTPDIAAPATIHCRRQVIMPLIGKILQRMAAGRAGGLK